MKTLLVASVAVVALGTLPDVALCGAPVQRYLLVAGANYGGQDRARLQYAVSDAERFGRVLVDLGGVAEANQIVLKDPKLREFLQALDQISARVAEGRRAAAGNGGGRTEVLLYYSGHADEKGLLIGDDRYSYRSLRDRLDQIPADVRIAVLDACASGAFLRMKGGKTRPAFLVDESSTMRGHAFLTSSAETEAAQESDRIRASYFTHYLVSGLRGAADLSGDGKVTLNEAYQFAFNETLGRTEQTRGGAQHPSYDITMSGSGDVVMTDVRQMSATLVLGEEMAGRFFIRNSAQQLVVELFKPAGRKVELGLEPGAYEVRLERNGASLVTRTRIGDGARVALDAALFQKTTPEPTRTRGTDTVPAPTFSVAGRNRIEFRLTPGPGIQYGRYLREDLALTVGFGGEWTGSGSSVVAFPIGLRWNPRTGDLRTRAAKPYLEIGAGPVFGTNLHIFAPGISQPAFAHSGTFTTFIGSAGAGIDFHVSRSWSMGLTGRYTWMRHFPEPFNRSYTYEGMQLGACVGLLIGRGREPR